MGPWVYGSGALVAAANAFGYWPKRSPVCSGFYDLSKDEEISARFESAATSGLDGFAIYHYRFDDRDQNLTQSNNTYSRTTFQNAFDYFYIWANENWSTRWVGGNIRAAQRKSHQRQAATNVARHVELSCAVYGISVLFEDRWSAPTLSSIGQRALRNLTLF